MSALLRRSYSDAVTFTPVIKIGELEMDILKRTVGAQCLPRGDAYREVDAYREEILIEHEPVGQVVSEREEPWEKDGVMVMPVYEEQLVVTKRLVLKERLRVRRVATTERHLFEDTLRHERLVIDNPEQTGLIHEQYPTGELAGEAAPATNDDAEVDDKAGGGLIENLVRKALG